MAPDQTAEGRKAHYAHEEKRIPEIAAHNADDDLPVLPKPNNGERKYRKSSLDRLLSTHLFAAENIISDLIPEMKAKGRLPELFRRYRKLFDKLEAETAEEEAASHISGVAPDPEVAPERTCEAPWLSRQEPRVHRPPARPSQGFAGRRRSRACLRVRAAA